MKKLWTKRIVMGIGAVLLTVVLVFIGALKSSNDLEAKGIFKNVEDYFNNGDSEAAYTILEIIPDDGQTTLSYFVGEQEPYSDGNFETENDFTRLLSIEEQREYVDKLEELGILTRDESSAGQYPLYFTNDSVNDRIFKTTQDESLTADGYQETEGKYLAPGTFSKTTTSSGQVVYTFTPNSEYTTQEMDFESTAAYIMLEDGTTLPLTYSSELEAYVVPGTGEPGGSGDGNDGGAGTGTVPATGASIDTGVVNGIDGVDSNAADTNEVTVSSGNATIDTTDSEYSIMATGDTASGYGYVSGYLYTKNTEAYTIVNNELLKKNVFGKTSDEIKSCAVDIRTVMVSELETSDILGADMIYIHAGSYGTEGVSKDISGENARELVARVAKKESRIPCIMEYAIYDTLGATQPNSNMYKISLMLRSEDLNSTYEYMLQGSTGESWDQNTDSTAWKNVKSYIPEILSNNGHYVNDNVYFVNDIKLVSADFLTTFPNKVVTEGFSDVYNAIVYENATYPDREAMIPDLIDPSIVMQYLVNYEKGVAKLFKTSLRVLELEPCYSFNWDTDSKKADFIQKYAPSFTSNPEAVEIVCMSTAEFVGKNDNLNATYDMIYIGSNLNSFQMEETYVKDIKASLGQRYSRLFNDSNMRGIIYSHVGDITSNNGLNYGCGGGLLDSHYVYNEWCGDGNCTCHKFGYHVKAACRFPGNDITSHNMEDLLEYLKSGYPVVVADNFFLYDNAPAKENKVRGELVTGINGGIESMYIIQPTRYICKSENSGSWSEVSDKKDVIRFGILDSSSYMYQFIKEAIGTGNSVDWKNRKYKNLLNEKGACGENQFIIEEYLNKQKLYLNVTRVPTRYSYTTQGKYDVIKDARYLTMNEDGKYYLQYEFSISNISQLTNTSDRYTCKLFIDDNFDGKFSKTQEEVSELNVTETATGKKVAVNDLVANVSYTVTRQLPADYVGCIQWQLMVCQNSNTFIQGTETGLTAIKSTKETINILQILPATGDGLNLEAEKGKSNSAWAAALNNVPDFNINIQAITAKNFSEKIHQYLNKPGVDKNHPEYFFDDCEEIFGGKGTDMLLMGFIDCYGEIDDKEAVDAIVNFAKSGRSILCSHDMTSWRNDYRGFTGASKKIGWETGGNASVYLSVRIREISGMDAYGCTVNRYQGSFPSNTGRGYNKYNNGKITDEWQYLVNLGRDMAFKPNTNQEQTVGETSGTNYIQLRDEWKSAYFPYRLKDRDMYGDGDKTLIEKVNDGVITSYPYEIPDRFVSSTTHSQYFTLDMEEDDDEDGESDVVVWYTVNSRKIDSTKKDLFNVSPNDVCNNYYIYNKGNVIYTGMGHTSYVGDWSVYMDEVKLFINTMVAAYRAGVKAPEISIVDNADAGAPRVNFIGIPYDEALGLDPSGNLNTQGDLNATNVKVYFELNDNNIIINAERKIVAEVWLDDTELAFENTAIYNCENGAKVTSTIQIDGKTYYTLESGKKYYALVNLTPEQIQKSCKIDIKVFSQVKKTSGIVTSERAKDSVTVSRVDMFDLD